MSIVYEWGLRLGAKAQEALLSFSRGAQRDVQKLIDENIEAILGICDGIRRHQEFGQLEQPIVSRRSEGRNW